MKYTILPQLDFLEAVYYNSRNYHVVITTLAGDYMDFSFLSNTKLFQGISPEEVQGMMGCLGFYEKRYPKDTVIFHAGDTVTELGLVMAGSVNIIVNTYWGTTSILGHVGKGEIFGEAYAAIPGKELLCEVVTCEECRVLFLPMSKALTQCGNGCGFHNRLIHNLIRISAGKNLNLSNRMMHITPRTIRERLLSYLSEEMMAQGNVHFAIPFTRQQLADYLCVDRSALSNELSKMQKEGLLTFCKNEFALSTDLQDKK